MSIDHNHEDDNDAWRTDVVFSPPSQLSLYRLMSTYLSLLTGRKEKRERETEKNWQGMTLVNSICSPLVSICSWEKHWTEKHDRWIHISPSFSLPLLLLFAVVLTPSKSYPLLMKKIIAERTPSGDDALVFPVARTIKFCLSLPLSLFSLVSPHSWSNVSIACFRSIRTSQDTRHSAHWRSIEGENKGKSIWQLSSRQWQSERK